MVRGYQRNAAVWTRVGSRPSRAGSKRPDELGRRAGLGALEQARAVGQPADKRARVGPARAQLREADGAVTLGEALAVVAEQQGHVGVAGHGRQPEQLVEPQLAGRRGQQVGAAHDVRDPLIGVVDDDRELVGDDPVAAPQDDVAARVARAARPAA